MQGIGRADFFVLLPQRNLEQLAFRCRGTVRSRGQEIVEGLRDLVAALESDDKVTLNTLDLFRKDVSTYVRLYDFMSQIVDYGDPYMEMLSIFLRLLEKFIADSSLSGSSTTRPSPSTSP